MRRSAGLNILIPTVIAVSALVPGVAAEEVCWVDAVGMRKCTQRLPYSARVAIGASILGTLLLSIILFLILYSRRSRREMATVYHVDAAQVRGPPTTIATSFDPRTSTIRHSATYPGTPGIVISHVPSDSAPSPKGSELQRSPSLRSTRYGSRPPQTAPVPQSYAGGYPFPGYSPKLAPHQPRTAFAPSFPRPLYTGQPVQRDDLREVHRDVV